MDITQLIEKWIKDGVRMNDSATDTDFENCEQVLGFVFTDDFKALYKKINGFRDWDMDSEMLSLWPLERIAEEYESNGFIGFCDWSINCIVIGFLKSQQGVYKNYYNNKAPSFACVTFTAFLEHWYYKTGAYL